jgi:aminoacrylate hydrolase
MNATGAARNTLHYQVEGSGPAIMLICGLGGLGEFWQPIARLLAPSYTLISFDHPGVGKSPVTDGHTISGMARDVCALLDHLGIEKAHMVGHSTGGLIAQALALDYPQRVVRIVMSGSWAVSDRRMRDVFAIRRTVLQELGLPAYRALSALLAYPPDWYEAQIARDPELDLHVSRDEDISSIVARMQMLLTFDRSQELAGIAAPVLVIGAPDDQVVPFYLAQALARLIPAARLVELAGGHLFPLVQPDGYASAVKNHLEGTD